MHKILAKEVQFKKALQAKELQVNRVQMELFQIGQRKSNMESPL